MSADIGSPRSGWGSAPGQGPEPGPRGAAARYAGDPERCALAGTGVGASVEGTGSAGATSAAEQHVRLHSGILQLFVRLAEKQPLVLVLDEHNRPSGGLRSL